MVSLIVMGSARSSFSIFSQDMVVTALSLVSSVFLARWLGPEQLGLFLIVSLIPTYSEKFGRIGNFDAAGVYYIKTKRHSLADVVSHLTIISFLSSLLPIILYACFSDVFQTYVVKGAHLPKLYIWTAVVTIPFMLLIVSYNKIFIGEGQVFTFNVVQILKPALMLAIAAAFYFSGWDYFGVVIAGSAATLVTAIYSMAKMSRLAPLLRMKLDKKLVRDLLGYGGKIYVLTVINFIHLRIDLLLVAVYLDPKQVSYYGMATTIGQLLWKIPNALSIVLFPKVAAQKPDDAADFTARACRAVTLILIGLSVLMLAVSAPFIRIVYGARYLPLMAPLIFITPGIITMGIARVLQEHFYGQGHPRGIVSASVISMLLNAVLNLWWIPIYGIKGAALASSITYTIYMVWLVFEFRKRWAKGFVALMVPTRQDFETVYTRFRAMTI